MYRAKQLRVVNVSAWANKGCGLSEVRDIREATTIAAAMDKIQQRDLEGAMDILCQRILALQAAKANNGSWGKAEGLVGDHRIFGVAWLSCSRSGSVGEWRHSPASPFSRSVDKKAD